MKNILHNIHVILPVLVISLSLSSCGQFSDYPTQQKNEKEHIEQDSSCSYFYFLWAAHEEYNQHYKEALDAYHKALICDPAGDYIRNKIPILYLKMDEPEKAIDILIREINEQPTDIERRTLLARIFIQQKNNEKAIEQYLQIITYEPANEQALLRLGVLISQTGDLENARSYFSKLLDINPESYFSLLYLARIADQVEDNSEAEKQYLSALDLNWSEDLIYEISELYLKNKEYEKNITLLRAAQEKGSHDERIRLTIVQTLLALDKEEEAIAELSLAKGTTNNPENISLILSRLHLRNGNTQKAIENLQAVLETGEAPEASYLLAIILLDSEEYEQALDALKHISTANEEFEDTVILKSRILHQVDRDDEAIKMMKDYLANENTRKPIFYAVAASLLRDKKRYEETTQLLELGIKHFPGNEKLLFEYGLQLERCDRLEEAIVIMEQIIAKNSDHPEALNFVGYSWADTDRNFEKAMEYIVKALRLKPNNGYIQDSLGWIHFKLGNLEKAKNELIGALKLVPDDPYILEHLGDVYLALDMVEKAQIKYKEALNLYEDEKKQKNLREKIEKIKTP